MIMAALLLSISISPSVHATGEKMNGGERGGGDDRIGEFTDAARRVERRLEAWEKQGASPVPEVPAVMFRRLIEEAVVETLRPLWITVNGKKIPNFQTVIKKGRRIRVPVTNLPAKKKIVITGLEWDELKGDDARERFAFHELVRLEIAREDDYDLSTPYWDQVARDRDDRSFRRELGLEIRELRLPLLGPFDLRFAGASLAMSAVKKSSDYGICTAPGSDTVHDRRDLDACTAIASQVSAVARNLDAVPPASPDETLEAKARSFLVFAEKLPGHRGEAIRVYNRLIEVYRVSFEAAHTAAAVWVSGLEPACPGPLNQAVACAVRLFEEIPGSRLAREVAIRRKRVQDEIMTVLKELESDTDVGD